MASLIATTTTITTTTTLTKLSFLSLHRTSFRALSSRFRSSLTTLHHRDLPSFSPNHPVTCTPLSRRSDDDFFPHAFPPTRSRQSRADKTAPWNAAVVDKKKKATTTTTTTEEPRYSKAARRFYNQRFREPPQRLAKVLAAAGVASRRSSEELIFQKKVTVNGTVCDKPQTRVDPGKDVIYVNGNRLPKRLPPKVYLALNKPKGYICSAGLKESKSVLCLFDDFLKSWDKKFPGELKPRLFTVGRLDVATTGLIIVTNDGDFAQRVSHPSSNLTKEYIATVVGDVHKRHLVALGQGTTIDGVHCTPEYVELLPRQPDKPKDRLRIVVNEGRNHEVREMVKNAGLEIHTLKRTRIGGFRLSTDLRLGKYVELKENDLKALGGEK
ncbi:putative ribosomal large subunit pseudouridine synthase SVR1, chloroplastic [Silene latifolia]|uniref:putative ribosomal large subunit pseudouridine synthase SVR1, chloroplastic n=1 Tax=Silene latifolia TaxID=37657 RepID=UPI003D787624